MESWPGRFMLYIEIIQLTKKISITLKGYIIILVDVQQSIWYYGTLVIARSNGNVAISGKKGRLPRLRFAVTKTLRVGDASPIRDTDDTDGGI